MSVKDKAAAIDRFVRTIKESGAYDDIQAACIMAGWTNLAGALYPLKGAAPTNNGFLATDLDAGIGLKGDGSSKYIDSNRAGNADGQNDVHVSAYVSVAGSAGNRPILVSSVSYLIQVDPTFYYRLNQGSDSTVATASVTGFAAASRASASALTARVSQTDYSDAKSSITPFAADYLAYRNTTGSTYSDATLSWYSIGSATDLAALDSAVSTLMADLRAIDEAGFDRDALAYIRNVEAADGAYLETEVKKAINRFFVGTKKDGTFSALKASTILCGARTIAGALVPLVVDYGPELVDINNLPTPLIVNSGGSAGAWDAATKTASNTATGSSNTHPRFVFSLGATAGKQYRVTGKLRINAAGSLKYLLLGTGIMPNDSTYTVTGEFSQLVTPTTDGLFRIYLDGTVANASVTIESLSIREDRSTPTAVSFTSGDYDRETGLKGNGSTKYLDSNRAGNADGQNDHHLAVHFGSPYSTANGCFAGSRSATQIGNQLTYDSGAFFISASQAQNEGAVATLSGLYGVSREQASGFDFRYNGSTAFANLTATSVASENIFIFNRPVSSFFSNARIAFYSTGSSVDLALLDNRVTNLVTEIAAAIP